MTVSRRRPLDSGLRPAGCGVCWQVLEGAFFFSCAAVCMASRTPCRHHRTIQRAKTLMTAGPSGSRPAPSSHQRPPVPKQSSPPSPVSTISTRAARLTRGR